MLFRSLLLRKGSNAWRSFPPPYFVEPHGVIEALYGELAAVGEAERLSREQVADWFGMYATVLARAGRDSRTRLRIAGIGRHRSWLTNSNERDHPQLTRAVERNSPGQMAGAVVLGAREALGEDKVDRR